MRGDWLPTGVPCPLTRWQVSFARICRQTIGRQQLLLTLFYFTYVETFSLLEVFLCLYSRASLGKILRELKIVSHLLCSAGRSVLVDHCERGVRDAR